MKKYLIIIFWLLWFLNFSSRIILSPLLPVIEDEFALNHATAGSLFLCMSIGYTVSLFMSGLVSSYIGQKRAIIYSFVIMIFVLISFKFAHSFIHIAILSFLIGLTSGFYQPCGIPLLTKIYGNKNWGKVIGFHETAASVSLLSIPLLVAFFIQFIPWDSFFLLLGFVCVLVIIIFGMSSPDHRSRKSGKNNYSSILCRKDFWIIGTLWSIMGMAAFGIYSIVPLFLVKEKGIALEMSNTLFGISRIGGMLSTFLIGFIIDRYSVKKIIFLLILLTGLSTIGISIAKPFWLVVGMLFIQASLCVAFYPAALIIISKITDFGERSTFTGATVAMAALFALGLSPVALGAAADRWNFQTGILILGIITTLSCGLIKSLKQL